MARISPEEAGGKNRVAFLDMIAMSELGAALLAESDDGYNVLVGSSPASPHLFQSYDHHPNVLVAVYRSTAAGRYQILYRFWQIYQKRLNLPDFGPVSQDKYALQQLKEQGALPYIDAGKFASAVAKSNNIWASLTGSPYGQHTHPITYLESAYQAAGGTVVT